MASYSSSDSMAVQPAQLAFLAIYNPSLGPTDETFDQQLVFHYSRAAHEAKLSAKKNARIDAAGGDTIREEENERLRQIGLAQGMVDFARSFSDGEPVDAIETEKSRIVLREVEKGWWVLASVDLTRLPSMSPSSTASSKKTAEKTATKPTFEYSSREVSPAPLLLEQLHQAHHLFCLHHGPSLSDLWVRLSRDKFCSTLSRFWLRFARSWDVLLHGNPAADTFSGIKVSSGGELGFGVGEEEWGSGERDVLEDLTRRTEGLVDVVVSRFGEPAPKHAGQSSDVPETEALPWMGSGHEPTASDGIIFGGVGAIERQSLRDTSLWMRQIYTNGDYAYGIRDNPQRERRKRRRHNPPPASNRALNGAIDKERPTPRNGGSTTNRTEASKSAASKTQSKTATALNLPSDPRPDLHPRVASQDHASTPQETPTPQLDRPRTDIPPPVASAVEQALDKATNQADKDAEREREEVYHAEEEEEADATTLGIPDQYMKYLTFGLSTFAKPAPKKRPRDSRKVSTAPGAQAPQTKGTSTFLDDPIDEDEDVPAMMTQLQPMPDGESLQAKIATQKRLENRGYFLVGLKGDLDAGPVDDEASATDGSIGDESQGSRIVLRTVQVKMTSARASEEAHDSRRPSLPRQLSHGELTTGYRRLRAIIYAHRPFIYCFLFEASTSSLQYTSFYRTLRQNLMPIHKPLLSSTSAAKVAHRIENSHLSPSPAATETASITSRSSRKSLASSSTPPSPAPIFDLIYDPRLLTVHTSIPNIPEPGTPAAEGILSTTKTEPAVAGWTRIEAMNVHSQILNTLASVKKRKTEVERTSKTSRGWWVVWMKVPPSASPADPDASPPQPAINKKDTESASRDTLTAPGASTPAAAKAIPADLSRIAFLVRRATDTPATSTSASSRFVSASSSRAMSSMFSNMTFGLVGPASEEAVTGGAREGWGPQALSGGIGVDARGYVEGLLRLGR